LADTLAGRRVGEGRADDDVIHRAVVREGDGRLGDAPARPALAVRDVARRRVEGALRGVRREARGLRLGGRRRRRRSRRGGGGRRLRRRGGGVRRGGGRGGRVAGARPGDDQDDEDGEQRARDGGADGDERRRQAAFAEGACRLVVRGAERRGV